MGRQGPERSRLCPRSGSPPGPRLHTSWARAGVLSPHHSPFQSLPTALVGVGTPGISCLLGQGPGKAGGGTQGFPQPCHSGTRPASGKQGLGSPILGPTHSSPVQLGVLVLTLVSFSQTSPFREFTDQLSNELTPRPQAPPLRALVSFSVKQCHCGDELRNCPHSI